MQLSIQEIHQRLLSHKPTAISEQTAARAAVLIPIVQKDDGLYILFTKRTDSVEHHKGQISFPGGVCDVCDDSMTATALREADEEIGLSPSAVRVLGQLDDIHIPSGFVVTPIVGYIEILPVLKTSADEVAELLFIPLSDFFERTKRKTEIRELKGQLRQIYIYDVWKEPVWGATAHMIKQFTDLFEIL
jgi:8-oxo-dGTP pyrophosphatase MutT (NUDIX family)